MLESLVNFLNQNHTYHFLLSPEITDFTTTAPYQISLLNNSTKITFPLPHDVKLLAGILASAIFAPGKTVYTRDLKRLISYLQFRLGRSYKFDFTAEIIDLQYLTNFFNSDNIDYNQIKTIHQKIHLPLALKVLPKLEAEGIIVDNNKFYTCYDIEGQKNGRLNSHCPNKNYVYAFSKPNIKAKMDHILVELDFQAMEVCVLAWLSGDVKLLKIIQSGRDIYLTIGQVCFNKECRQEVKNTFLPIIYGLNSELKEIYRKFFPQAFTYIENIQDHAENGRIVYDYFQRPRTHEKSYFARNAVIQGTAAIICQSKLITLDALDLPLINFTHDSYLLQLPKNKHQELMMLAIQHLQKPSEWFPYSLRVHARIGNSIHEMSEAKL